MQDILRELGQRFGVRGSLLVTRDGVIVATRLGDGLDSESVAALASAVIGETARAAERVAIGPIRRMVLTASIGRLLFEPVGDLVLVVATEPNIELEHMLLEITGPARRIRELARLDSPLS
jgi:uncharacterized protein